MRRASGSNSVTLMIDDDLIVVSLPPVTTELHRFQSPSVTAAPCGSAVLGSWCVTQEPIRETKHGNFRVALERSVPSVAPASTQGAEGAGCKSQLCHEVCVTLWAILPPEHKTGIVTLGRQATIGRTLSNLETVSTTQALGPLETKTALRDKATLSEVHSARDHGPCLCSQPFGSELLWDTSASWRRVARTHAGLLRCSLGTV